MKEITRDPAVLERMKMAFELYQLAEIMARQNLLRRHPGLGESEVEERVLEWLSHRPGDENGDVDGPSFVSRSSLNATAERRRTVSLNAGHTRSFPSKKKSKVIYPLFRKERTKGARRVYFIPEWPRANGSLAVCAFASFCLSR